MDDQNIAVFQYHDQESYPIFVSLNELEASDAVTKLLEQMKFRELTGREADEVQKTLSATPHARLLELKPASSKVMAQIESASHSDRYGSESVLPKTGYKVYRYRDYALMVYSYAANSWECGVSEYFGQEEEGIFAARTIVNRFLSWALVPHGVIGFWGVPVKEGMVILKQKESQGEVVFVDLSKRKVLSMDGAKSQPLRFRILRLDNKIKNKNIRMTSEELLSFLSVHTSFLDPQGHSRPMRQLLQALSRSAEGVIHPRESFQSREETL
ncbi:MAG: hypothetical protein VXV96_14125 [Bdellovibrionota bacterium]|jgi:hypothetical protein|nr:hypothetical protein [Bdellovibrionota bacterium]